MCNPTLVSIIAAVTVRLRLLVDTDVKVWFTLIFLEVTEILYPKYFISVTVAIVNDHALGNIKRKISKLSVTRGLSLALSY